MDYLSSQMNNSHPSQVPRYDYAAWSSSYQSIGSSCRRHVVSKPQLVKLKKTSLVMKPAGPTIRRLPVQGSTLTNNTSKLSKIVTAVSPGTFNNNKNNRLLCPLQGNVGPSSLTRIANESRDAQLKCSLSDTTKWRELKVTTKSKNYSLLNVRSPENMNQRNSTNVYRSRNAISQFVKKNVINEQFTSSIPAACLTEGTGHKSTQKETPNKSKGTFTSRAPAHASLKTAENRAFCPEPRRYTNSAAQRRKRLTYLSDMTTPSDVGSPTSPDILQQNTPLDSIAIISTSSSSICSSDEDSEIGDDFFALLARMKSPDDITHCLEQKQSNEMFSEPAVKVSKKLRGKESHMIPKYSCQSEMNNQRQGRYQTRLDIENVTSNRKHMAMSRAENNKKRVDRTRSGISRDTYSSSCADINARQREMEKRLSTEVWYKKAGKSNQDLPDLRPVMGSIDIVEVTRRLCRLTASSMARQAATIHAEVDETEKKEKEGR